MLEFLPESALSQEKTAEMLREGMAQIDRINRFVENMRVLSSLESKLFSSICLEAASNSCKGFCILFR